jgi:two-component system, cell cycle response regulator
MSVKPVANCPSGEPCQLITEFEILKQEVQRLSELVSSDPLTNLFNYRHFSHTLEQEIERSQRTLQPTALIMIDADHFKKVNDQWGHEVGNLALKLIADCIFNNIRKLDIACRYGGEEFAVILPSSDMVTSTRVAERIRLSIESTPLIITNTSGEEETIWLTASAGLSLYNGHIAQTPTQLVKAADEQLYQAKKQGRNRICFTNPDTSIQQVSKDEKTALLGMFKHK